MVAPRKRGIPGATGSIGQTVARVRGQGGNFCAAGRDGAALARMAIRLVASACDKALADGTARTPATVEDALAVHHMVKESLTPHLV